jgi:hypothetical protein
MSLASDIIVERRRWDRGLVVVGLSAGADTFWAMYDAIEGEALGPFVCSLAFRGGGGEEGVGG